MDGILQLLKPVLESKSKDQTLKNLLTSCADQRAFSKGSSGIPSLIGLINIKLNEPSSRHDGLLLLQALLPQCTLDILAQNASSWMQFCLKGTLSSNTSQVSFLVLKTLLDLSVKIPELTKTVSSNVVPNLAEQIHQGILPQSYLCALECLEQCMSSYNGPCGPHKKVFERFLLSLVDYTGHQRLKVLWQAARCMAFLPQIGGGGTGGTMHKCAWAAQQKSLCRTIHIILDDLYADSNELQVTLLGGMLEGVDPLPLTPLEDVDPVLKTQKLTARLTALSAFLQAMLVVRFPVSKNISLSSILNVVCRGIAVNGSSIGPSTTNHSLALATELPKVHYSLLKLLESLILVARHNLLPFAGLICRLAMQTLKWTRVDKWAFGTDKPFSSLRIQAYGILTLWCGTAKTGSLIEDSADQLVELALHDIYSEKDSVLLSATLSRKNKYTNRKQLKRKMNASQDTANQSSVSQDSLLSVSTLNENANSGVCTAALQSLRSMLSASSCKMQAALHKVLQETVVAILLQVTGNPLEPVIPYSAFTPRLELFRLLLQLVLDSHPVWPAPTNVALKLFAKGLNDSNAEVSMFCSMAQSSVEKIIHPAYASLYFKTSTKNIEACQAEVFESPALSSTFRKSVVSSTNHGYKNSHIDGQELTDAASLLTTEELQRQSITKESRNRVAVLVQSLNENSPSSGHESLKSGDVSSSPAPLSHSVLTNDIKLASSTPHVSAVKKSVSTNQVDSAASKSQTLNLSSKSDSSAVDGQTKISEVNNKKALSEPSLNLDVLEGGSETVKSPVKDIHVEQMIDITGSDKSDDDISEVPCEIDIADSEDDKSSISICSQVTISSPLGEKGSKAVPFEQKSDKVADHENIPKSETVVSEVECSTEESQNNDVDMNGSLPESNHTEEVVDDLHQEEKEKSPSPPLPATPPRVLRSRTISSSSAPNTPSRKSSRKTITIDTTLEEEEVMVSCLKTVEEAQKVSQATKPTENGVAATLETKKTDERPPDSSPETKVSVLKPSASPEKRAADGNGGPEFKKPKIVDDDDNYVYEDDLDEEAMLSSFIDVTQGEEGF